MAQGYLGSNKNAEMEIIGKGFFMNLAMRSFFQEFEKDDDDGSIIECKMHDIVHDLAQFLAKNECSIIKVEGVNAGGMESSSTKARHSTLAIEAEVSSLISICNARNLRTLLVEHSWSAAIDITFISHLKCVRALNLRGCSIKEVLMEIGKLIHLRYLDLSYNPDLERLPETVCDLHNLQTLNLKWCGAVEKLPQGMGKLINLRYLVIFGNFRMMEFPKGIGRLSCLRTLRWFIVSGGKDCSKLGDLEKLNHLRSLFIAGLKNVADVSEAGKAKLKNKKHLRDLVIFFSQVGKKRVNENEGMMDNDVLEAMKAPPDLELLRIFQFCGRSVSSSFILALTKLRKLEFDDWPKCECLPPLGKLPFLESLEIGGMDVLKTVGVEFLGISLDDSDTPIVAFPKLKKLYFGWMAEWEDWDVPANRRVTLMPLLLSLEIKGCKKLKTLQNHLSQMTNLERLEIEYCPILKQRCEEGADEWHKISHIPCISIQ